MREVMHIAGVIPIIQGITAAGYLLLVVYRSLSELTRRWHGERPHAQLTRGKLCTSARRRAPIISLH